MTCGDIHEPSWSGVIMESTCSLHNSHGTNHCQTVQQLNMTLQNEMPVFDWKHNVTYRNIACARCSNNEGNMSFWGLNITCKRRGSLGGDTGDIKAVKRFVNSKDNGCSWKYTPLPNLKQHYSSCVIHDSQCASNQLPEVSVVKELCSSYSMAFSVNVAFTTFKYRNPHCALCNPDGKSKTTPSSGAGPIFPPWSILLDVSTNVVESKGPKNPHPTIITGPAAQGYNMTSQMFNCTSYTSNMSICKITFRGKTCEIFTKNQSMNVSLMNRSRLMLITTKQILYDRNIMKLQGNTVYILCPEHQADNNISQHDPVVLIYITVIGTILSIISLCFLLSVYLSFNELRNLPGKCLINLSVALLCYQTVFLSAKKSTEVFALCKAVAIFLHFFILSAFSWMSIMAFDTAATFTRQGK